jgi:spermidine synthase
VSPKPRFLVPLLFLFLLSGCSGLIYEIVWLQMLQLVVGSTAVSLSVLLATFMGGMCAGSLLLPRLEAARRNPLRVYALLEAATALGGILVFLILPAIEHLYISAAAHGLPNMALRGAACAICLLPPTFFMGATLPVISRQVAAEPGAASWWGWLYGANLGGGVIGCFGAGFYLLRVHDMAFANAVAVALNLVVAAVAFTVSGRPLAVATQQPAPEGDLAITSPPNVYWPIAISGFCALGAEVVWTRLLSLMLGPTVYTFSIILGVFLIGLGAGSAAGSRLARTREDSARWLGWSQLLAALAVCAAAILLARSLPYWPGNVDSTAGPFRGFLGDMGRCAIAVLPAAIAWGASFPLALGAVAGAADSGRAVGQIYGANTAGAILGSVAFSLLFIPSIGTRDSQRLLILASALAAALVLWRSSKTSRRFVLGTLPAAALLIWLVPPTPWKLIGFGRRLPTTSNEWSLLWMGEGMNSSVVWSLYEGGTVYFHVSGKVEASTEPQDMSLQRMLGHLPALLHPHARSALIVGFGAGVTAGTFVVHPEIERIRICEIEPLIPPHSTQYFRRENHNVMNDPRTRIVYDDARHFILTTPERFDIITSDPIHPFVKGMASLYTTEYFEMCKRHLNPGGFVTQWVPLYETDFETVRSELATFFEAFPHGAIWGNLNTDGSGYDVVLVGHDGPLSIDVDAVEQKLASPAYARVAQSLREAGFRSAVELIGDYAASATDLTSWLRGAEINRDRNLRLQYLAGLGLNQNLADTIYSRILRDAAYPAALFHASPGRTQLLRAAFDNSHALRQPEPQ